MKYNRNADIQTWISRHRNPSDSPNNATLVWQHNERTNNARLIGFASEFGFGTWATEILESHNVWVAVTERTNLFELDDGTSFPRTQFSSIRTRNLPQCVGYLLNIHMLKYIQLDWHSFFFYLLSSTSRLHSCTDNSWQTPGTIHPHTESHGRLMYGWHTNSDAPTLSRHSHAVSAHENTPHSWEQRNAFGTFGI